MKFTELARSKLLKDRYDSVLLEDLFQGWCNRWNIRSARHPNSLCRREQIFD